MPIFNRRLAGIHPKINKSQNYNSCYLLWAKFSKWLSDLISPVSIVQQGKGSLEGIKAGSNNGGVLFNPQSCWASGTFSNFEDWTQPRGLEGLLTRRIQTTVKNFIGLFICFCSWLSSKGRISIEPKQPSPFRISRDRHVHTWSVVHLSYRSTYCCSVL